jgi:hypothetical protein
MIWLSVNRLYFIVVCLQRQLPENYGFNLCQIGGSLRRNRTQNSGGRRHKLDVSEAVQTV